MVTLLSSTATRGSIHEQSVVRGGLVDPTNLDEGAIMSTRSFVAAGCLLGLATACNFNVPFDPAELVRPIDEALNSLQNGLEGALADPFGTRPFPVLVGGDGERVYTRPRSPTAASTSRVRRATSSCRVSSGRATSINSPARNAS